MWEKRWGSHGLDIVMLHQVYIVMCILNKDASMKMLEKSNHHLDRIFVL